MENQKVVYTYSWKIGQMCRRRIYMPIFILNENIVKKPSSGFISENTVPYPYTHSHIYLYTHTRKHARMHTLLVMHMSFLPAESFLGGEHLYLHQAFADCFIFMFPLMEDCVFNILFVTFYGSFAL